jgi:hypothetical protein
MTADEITSYILTTFPNVQTADNYGYKFFFYGDDHMRPFATLATSDSDYDRYSNLDRPAVFRLNIGMRKDTFQELFGTEKINPADYDFTQLDRLMPHPEYAAQFFVCVVSPSDATLPTVKKFLAEAHAIAAKRTTKSEKP